jgi:hypothetical protein
MSAHCGAVNCDVKMQHLAKLETDQRVYYVWAVIGLGGLGAEHCSKLSDICVSYVYVRTNNTKHIVK